MTIPYTFTASSVAKSSEVNANFSYLEGVKVPTGAMVPFGGSSAPTGWLLCDGSAVSRSTYSSLFGVLSTSYGVGDGSSTFNVPDMRGFFPVGYKSTDTDFDALGHTGGEKTHTLTVPEMPSHTHAILNSVNLGGSGDVTERVGQANNAASVNTSSTGGGGAHNTLPPYVTFNFIIKT